MDICIGVWWKLGYPDPFQIVGDDLPWLYHIGVAECNRQLAESQLAS